MGFKILAINPGSTSTKIAQYDDEQPTLALTLRHSAEEIARFPRIIDQLDWRKEMVLEALAKNNFDVKSLSAVIGRGGLIKPIESGVYEVNAALKNDLVNAQREHASNLGGLIAEHKEGRWVHLSLSEREAAVPWIRCALEQLGGDPQIAADDELVEELRGLGVEVLCRRGLEEARRRHRKTPREEVAT